MFLKDASGPTPIASVEARAGHETSHTRAVQLMFSQLAGAYDRVNRVISAGRDTAWRRRAVELLGASPRLPEGPLLDLCAGTLDLAAELEERQPDRDILALDFSAEMLARGAHKTRRTKTMVADAMALPLEDASVAGVICGFGLRNVADPRCALSEIRRVLRPGGRVVILEFFRAEEGTWSGTATRALLKVVSKTVLPTVGWALAGQASAYDYLARSMAEFLTRRELEQAFSELSFTRICGEDLTLGVASIVTAERPETAGGTS